MAGPKESSCTVNWTKEKRDSRLLPAAKVCSMPTELVSSAVAA